MNNTKSNNIIDSLNESRYVTYTFPTGGEADEFCRDNHISTGNIEYDGEYFTVEVRAKDTDKLNKQNKPRKPMTEYQVSFTLISNHSQGSVAGRNKEKVKAYSSKQARTYLEKIYREKGYTVRDFKVTGERILDNAGFINKDRKKIGV